MADRLINKIVTRTGLLCNLMKINKDVNLLIKLRKTKTSTTQDDFGGEYYVGDIKSSQKVTDIKKIEDVMMLIENNFQGSIKLYWQEIASSPVTSKLVKKMVKKINNEKLYYKMLTTQNSTTDNNLQVKRN